jgi:hypothetical protein
MPATFFCPVATQRVTLLSLSTSTELTKQQFTMTQIKSFVPTLAFLLLSTLLSAQREQTVLGDRGWGFSGIWGGYHHQYTRYGDLNEFNRGGFFGFEFGKSLLVGWGNYRVSNEFNWQGTDNQPFTMRWNTFKLGYSFQSYRAIHPMLNFDFGRGRTTLAGVNDRIFVMQPAAGVEINVFRWFRLGLEGGYRFVQGNDNRALLRSDLEGPYGQASLRFGFSWGRYHKRKDSRDYRRNYEN